MSSLNPVCGCNFLVRFDQVEVPFLRVSGIRKQNKVEYIKEGGRNDAVLMLKKPMEDGIELTFENGVAKSTQSFFDLYKLVKKRKVTVEIEVLDSHRKKVRLYVFKSQGLLEYSVGNLDASSSEVLIQKIVLATTGILRME